MNRYERMNQERKIVDVRKRVAAYCRVSTDHEDQANSFESQQTKVDQKTADKANKAYPVDRKSVV